MIKYINKYLKNLDYKYIKSIKIIKSVFNVIYIIQKYKFNFFDMPFYIYKINKKIQIFIYDKLYKSIMYKYKKIKYTIFIYPKFFNNFNFIKYINDIIINDYYNIVDYYLNIFNIYKWRFNIFLLIFILWFYSILLISNMLLNFIIIKFIFYTLKYVLKYIFIYLDYIFYTYLNFTRMPKFLFGIPYLIIIKNMYRCYNIIFNILPSLIFIEQWINICYNLKMMFIKKINHLLDIIEYSIVAFSKSYLFLWIKKSWYHIKYYLTEEHVLKKYILYIINNIKIYYIYNIKYNLYIYLNPKIIYYIIYTYNNFKDKKNRKKRFIDFKKYIKLLYPYIMFKLNIYIKHYIFNLNIIHIKLIYIFINIIYNINLLKFYLKYIIKYNIKNIILIYKNIIYIKILYFYNILFLSFWHYYSIIIK